MTLSDQTRALLREVSTATLTTQMLKRGFRNVFMAGVRAWHPDGGNMVGAASTVRYIPAREDLDTIETLGSREHPQRKAIETIEAGRVLVIDCRGETQAAGAGAILMARLQARGAAGFVCDGGVRDLAAAAAVGLPVYCAGPAAPPNVTRHHALDMDRPIACGGVAVFPGDVIVGDRDGVVVLPAAIAEEVALAAAEQDRLETFLFEEVKAGASLFGTYPPNEAMLQRYEAQRTVKG
jgi:regulator of RNase E activity RraA